MISVLILTLNEEVNLPSCLDSVKWCDDIVVFDSFSTDQTTKLARSAGARLIQREFDNYGSQREAARLRGGYKYEWVLALDADEQPEPELVKELFQVVRNPPRNHNAYRMRRKDHFMGRWIKHATLYPSWFVRFYRHREIHYEQRAVHEYPVVKGLTGELNGHLVHNNFRKGLGDWWMKHVRYSDFEAIENLKSIETTRVMWARLLARDPVARRRALKELSFRLPCRPALRFLYMYFLRLGFLDGGPGYHYCRLLAIYEYMIVMKMKEIRRRERGLPL